MESSKQSCAKQAEEPQKEEKARASQNNSANSKPANTASVTTNLTATAIPGNVQNQQSPDPASSAAVVGNNYIAPGAKVGDIIKLGDVEMLVTKSMTRHKVIDINLKGNTPEQPPRLVLTENNRIVYEIPADVDVNVDVTEKTTIEKSPLFYGEQKAGQ